MLRAAWFTPAALVVVFLSSHTLWLSLVVENDDGCSVAEFCESFFKMHEGGAAGAAGFT